MNIADLMRSLVVSDGPGQDPELRRRAARFGASRPLTAVDDDLLTAASRVKIASRPVRDHLFDSIYPLCCGLGADVDYASTALNLFAVTQIGLRRYVPSGRQTAAQVGRAAGAGAFAAACAANPYQPATFYLLEDEPPPSPAAVPPPSPAPAAASGVWSRLFGTKPPPAAQTPAPSSSPSSSPSPSPSPSPSRPADALPDDPLRRALALSLNFIEPPPPPLSETPWRWKSDLHAVRRETALPTLEGDGRLGVLSLFLLDRPGDYATLLRRAQPRLTDVSAVLMCLPTPQAEEVVREVRAAFAGAPVPDRVDYRFGDGDGMRTVLHWSGAVFDPPPVPAVSTIKLPADPARMAALIAPSDPAFRGERIAIDPQETFACAPPSFIDGAERMPESHCADLRLETVEVPAHSLLRMDGGGVTLGFTRYELFRRAAGGFDAANIAKGPMFATMAQDGAGNVVTSISRPFDRHHYVHENADGTSRIVLPFESTRRIAGDCVLIYGSEANSHWLFEGFLPLYALERLGLDRMPTAIVTHDLQPYQRDMLISLGFDPERIVLTRPAERIVCDRLYAAEVVWKINRGMVELAERIAAAGAAPEPVDRHGRRYGPRLYVARTDARWLRRFLNENRLIEALEDMGFDVVVPSQLSPAELFAIFGQARVVAGPQGAGLLNTLFSPRGADVVMLSAELYYEQSLKRVAAAKGHRLGAICGESVLSDDRVFKGSVSDWLIDVDAVVRRLKPFAG